MRRAPERSLIAASEKRWLAKLVWWAFVLRAAVALALQYWGVSSRLAPDEDTYFLMGRGLALYWTGEVFTQPQRLTFDDPFAYLYLNALSYLLFSSSLPLKLVNAFMGALVCRYAYVLADSLYGPAAARRTALLVAVFPSLVLWSALNIRDVWIVFLLVYLSVKSYQLVAGY